MPSQIKRNIGCFTADFRGKKVSVGGKVFAAGFFFYNALNEYWREAPDGINSDPDGGWLIANRLISTHQPMWNVTDSLTIGYIDEAEAAKLHTNILYILKVIAKARPFRYLDLQAETERCDALFGTESVRRINQHLKEKAQHTLQSDAYWLSQKRPDVAKMKRLMAEEKHLQEYITTLDYYNKLGLDMDAAWDFGKGFVKRLPSLAKRDESHLIQLATECIAQVPFGRWNQPYQNVLSPDVEYCAIPKKLRSQHYVVGKRMTFVRFLDFLVADFFEGLHVGHYPLVCENCGRYFLKTNARFQRYCTGIDPNDAFKRPCNAVAAAKGREAKELHDDHPIKFACENRLKAIRVHVKRGKITSEQAKAAKTIAQERRGRALREPVYANTLYKKEIGQDSIYDAAGIKLSR